MATTPPEVQRHSSAYVTQDDIHLPTLTVRETLYYAAMLRMEEEVRDKGGGVCVWVWVCVYVLCGAAADGGGGAERDVFVYIYLYVCNHPQPTATSPSERAQPAASPVDDGPHPTNVRRTTHTQYTQF